MPTSSSLIGKIIIAMLASVIIGFPLSMGGANSLVSSLLIFGLLLFLFCLRLSYFKLVQVMIVVLFFLPFQYLTFLNIFNAINPLTFVGSVLLIKAFRDKVMYNAGPLSLKTNTIDKLYYFFLFSAFISTGFANSKLGALNWIYYSIVTGYIPFKIITYFDRKELIKIFRTLVLLGAICALEGIGEYVLKRSILFPVFPGRFTSLLGHPLVNGLIFSILLPLCLLIYLWTKEKRFICYSIIFFIAIILTQARGSWVAWVSGLVFVLLMVPVRVKIRFIIVVILVSAIIAVVPLLRNTLTSRAREYEGQKYSSWNVRLKSIPVAVEILKDKPFFGGGPFNAGRYKDEYSTDFTLRKTAFENSYLGLLVDFGILGFFLLFSIFAVVILRVVLATRSHMPHGSAMYLVLWSLIIMCINMATFNFDSYRSFSFVVWLFMALFFAFVASGEKGSISEIS